MTSPSGSASPDSGFALGTTSRSELAGVHLDLVVVVTRAIAISRVDFSVHDGIRLVSDQRLLVDSGASQTLDSRHLEQPDGFGHAVDLVPYIGGRLRWEWVPIYQVARAMKQAAAELEVRIRWGGCWELLETLEDPEVAQRAYVARRLKAGARPFADGPHYELVT